MRIALYEALQEIASIAAASREGDREVAQGQLVRVKEIAAAALQTAHQLPALTTADRDGLADMQRAFIASIDGDQRAARAFLAMVSRDPPADCSRGDLVEAYRHVSSEVATFLAAARVLLEAKPA